MRLLVSGPIILFSIVVLWSCRNHTNPMDGVQGVWKAEDFSFDKRSEVLIIKDSTVAFDPWGIYHYQSPLMLRDGMIIRIDPHGYDQSIFTCKGDSLIQLMLYDSTVRKYIKAEKYIDTTKHLYTDLLLQVTPPLWSTAKERSIDFSDSVRLTSHLAIGPMKRGEMAIRSMTGPDSVRIQVYDVLIGKDKLPRYLREQIGLVMENDRTRVMFILHADKSTPIAFLDAIRKQINDDVGCRVARAYWDDEANKIRWAEW